MCTLFTYKNCEVVVWAIGFQLAPMHVNYEFIYVMFTFSGEGFNKQGSSPILLLRNKDFNVAQRE
jgi:hypothetical protein